MVLAFMLTKCGVLGVYGVPIPESSRFFGNLLLLSGIPSQKIALFTVAFSTLLSVLKDFALYTFVFICVDLCILIVKVLF